ncbi:MAG: hypothetical protein KY054_00795 [Candidatus Nealsonbacteria bacterium]|nr:hypothetical protein [Candidatus Nealsonbacteria bacterium]
MLYPSFEWYLLSAHSLFSTFSKAVWDKGGRVIDSILLSGVIKKYNVDSKWGKEVIAKFCKKIVSQDERFKDSVLLRREIDDVRFLTVFFSTLAFIFIFIQAILPVFGEERLRWDHFGIIFLILSLVSFFMAGAIERKKKPFLGKFLAAFVLIALWHIILVIAPQDVRGAHMVGYVTIIAFLGIFRNIATVLIAGISSLISYLILFYFYYPHIVRLHPMPDMVFLAVIIVIVIFVTSSIQEYFLGLTDVQDELETSRMSLEIQVRARTRELEELRDGLEKSIEERTSELNKKVEEFEKFNKLIVGREMKMVDLKKKIEELEKEKKS